MANAETVAQTYVEYLRIGTKEIDIGEILAKTTHQSKTNNKNKHNKRPHTETQKDTKETTNGKTQTHQCKNQAAHTKILETENNDAREETQQKQPENGWRPEIPHTKIEHMKEEEHCKTPPDNTTATKYKRYRKDGVYECSINASKEIEERHPNPGTYLGEEFEWRKRKKIDTING